MPKVTFDYKGYLTHLGFAEDQMPDELNEDQKEYLYKKFTKDYYVNTAKLLKEQDSTLTKKELEHKALRQVVENEPDTRPYFGLSPEPITDKNEPFRLKEFQVYLRKHVDNSLRDARVTDYFDDYADTIINEFTDLERPFLGNLSKHEYKRMFLERTGISENMSVKAVLEKSTAKNVVKTIETVGHKPSKKIESKFLRDLSTTEQVLAIFSVVVLIMLIFISVKRKTKNAKHDSTNTKKDSKQDDQNQNSDQHKHEKQNQERKHVKNEEYYHDVLGLGRNCTTEEIKRRYRDLVAKYHPDKVNHLGEKLKKTAEKEMKKINEAYEYFRKKYGFR